MNTLAQATVGTASLVSGKPLLQNEKSDKGSIGNRLEYGVKQSFNLRGTMVKDQLTFTAGAALTAGATAAIAKSKTAQNFLVDGAKKIAGTKVGAQIATFAKDAIATVAPFAKKAVAAAAALPGPAKAVLAVGGILTTLAVEYVHNKGIYNAGKIDQEYTDKAKLQQIL